MRSRRHFRPAGGNVPGMAASDTGIDPGKWLRRSLSLSGERPSWSQALRAAVAFGAVTAAALAWGELQAGVFAASGMVLGVMQPETGPYRSRVLGLLVPQLAGAAGLVIGQLSHGHGWWAVAVTALVALVSGLISSIGRVASGAGLSLLFLNVIGTGLPASGALWLPPLCQLAGGAFYLLLALLSWRLQGTGADPGHRAVAEVYDKAADLLQALPRAGDAQAALNAAVDAAQDALMRHQIRGEGGWDAQTRWLVAMLNAATPLLEAVTVLARSTRPAPAGAAEAVRRIAEAVRAGHRDARIAPVPGDPVLARSIEYARARLSQPHPEDPDWLGLPEPLPVRALAAVRTACTSGAAWRYGARLALCMAIASAIVESGAVLRVLWVPTVHSVWLPLTVAVILKPDFGSVFTRALLRALGTVAAAVPTLLVLVLVPRGWAAVPLAAFFGGLIPVLKVKSYAARTVAVTPLMLFLFDMVSPQPSDELVLARLSDTLLGCLIVLVFGYACWPESWRARLGERLAAGLESAAGYLEEAFTGSHAAWARHRRALQRDLSAVQNALRQTLAEPPPAGRRGAAWWPVLMALQQLVDAVTAAAVEVREGAAPPPPREVAALAEELRQMAVAVRRERPPPTGEPPPVGDANVLEDVAVQVHRLRQALPL